MIFVRYAAWDDIEPMTELLIQLFSIEKDFAIDRNAQSRGLLLLLADSARSVVFVAEDEGRIVGMVTGQLIVSTAAGGYSLLLEDLIVDGDFQGKGIGGKLVLSLADWGRTNGAVRIQLVADRTNDNAIGFYEKLSFKSGRMVGYYRSIE